MPSHAVPVNDNSIAALLGLTDIPVWTIVLGHPDCKIKSIKVHKFAKRVQRRKNGQNPVL